MPFQCQGGVVAATAVCWWPVLPAMCQCALDRAPLFSPQKLITVLWHGNVAAVCAILHHPHASQISVSLVFPACAAHRPTSEVLTVCSKLTVSLQLRTTHTVEQSRLSCELFVCNCARRRHCCVWIPRDGHAAHPKPRTRHSRLQCKCSMSGCIPHMRHTVVGATRVQCSDSTTQNHHPNRPGSTLCVVQGPMPLPAAAHARSLEEPTAAIHSLLGSSCMNAVHAYTPTIFQKPLMTFA